MAKSDMLHIRVEPGVKASVEATLSTLGLSTAEAVNIFLHQVILNEGLPFLVKIPSLNAETIAAMQETMDMASGKIESPKFHSVAELMEDLTNETDD